MRIVPRHFPLAWLGVFLVVAAGMVLRAGAQTTAANEWTWVGGTVNGTFAAGVYGTLGFPAPTNFPGAHQFSSTWSDSSGNLWLFGGLGVDANGSYGSFMNDLWRFTPSTQEWTWMGGSSTAGPSANCKNGAGCGQPGVYGTLGTAAARNAPGGREGAASWADTKGNFWLFGGYGYDSAGTLVYLNDLWEFSLSTGEWTWMGGSSTVTGTCFGSEIKGYYCGGEPGVYGTPGVPSAGNIPGARWQPTSWVDASGDFWLFGGYTIDSNDQIQYDYNDLWKFSPSDDEWTWMGGTSFASEFVCDSDPNSYLYICGEPGTYGTMGSPSQENAPGARNGALSWVDKSGNLWLVGGAAFDGIGNYNPLNDMWVLNPATNEWTWVGGSNTSPLCLANWGDSCGGLILSPIYGSYGTLGTPAAGNIPFLTSNAANWTDNSGNFWLFSGADDEFGSGWNDLWEFSPPLNEWAWMGGTVPGTVGWGGAGVYGTLGIPGAGNIPGKRYGGASWSDKGGHLWLFGGWGYPLPDDPSYLNDLWEYQPANGPLPTAAPPTFSVVGGSYTTAQTVTLNDETNGAIIFYTVDGTTPTTSSIAYTPSASQPLSIPYSETLNAIAVASGCQTSAVVTQTYTLPTKVAAPIFSPPGGSYTSAQNVAITDTTPGVNIFYTTDGTMPTDSSSELPGGFFIVSTSETVNAVAVAYGYSANSAGASSVVTATYTINLPQAAAPTFNLPAGPYSSAQTVTLSDATNGATIYYTTNGTAPTTGSTVYAGPIPVTSTETIETIATASGYSASAVASATYTIDLPAAATPTFSVASGTFATDQSVAINDATAGATIYYTTDGTTPTTGSTVYGGPIPVMSTETIEAIATASGYSASAVATATYTIPQSFVLSMNPASMTVTAGASGTSTITLQDEGGFNGNVSFACSGLPAGATCSFTQLTVPTSAGVSYTTLTVATSSSAAEVRRGSGALLPGAAIAVAVCCFGLRKRRRLLMLALLAVGLGGLGLLGGCGGGGSGGGSGGGGTQPVTSTVTVTGTSGTLSSTATFALTVN
jgi:N-acetylneuraminic acid mutarotase